MVAVLWADRKLRLSDALVFLATLAATALPALLGGKSIGALLSIYTAQTGLYTGLTYNAPQLLRVDEHNRAGRIRLRQFRHGAGVRRVRAAGRLRREAGGAADAGGISASGAAAPLAIVFFLPRMHERYFYLADILSAVLAAKNKKAAPICALVALASLGSYWETALPLSFCALMMFAALILTLKAYPTGRKCDIIDQRQQNVTFSRQREGLPERLLST